MLAERGDGDRTREIDVQFLLDHSIPPMLRRYTVTYDGVKASDDCRQATRIVNQYLETFSSPILPSTKYTTRSQTLVTRSAMRSRLWATQVRWVARSMVFGSLNM